MSQSNLNLATKSTGPVECLGQKFPSDEARREHADHERGGKADHRATDDEGGEVVEGASLHAGVVPRGVGSGGRFDCAGGMRSLN